MMILYFDPICFTSFYFIFSAPNHLGYVFQFLHLFSFLMFFFKPLSSLVENLLYIYIYTYIYINNMYNIYILENLLTFA